jgi:hypothetical protein
LIDKTNKTDLRRVVTVAVEEEQEVGEADLGGTAEGQQVANNRTFHSHIEDGVCDDLGVDGELVGSLSQGKDDWVSGPKAEIISIGTRMALSTTYIKVIPPRRTKRPLVFRGRWLAAEDD